MQSDQAVPTLGVSRLPLQVVVQHHIAVVAAVGDIDIALVIDLQAVRQVVLVLALAGRGATILGQEFAFRANISRTRLLQ